MNAESRNYPPALPSRLPPRIYRPRNLYAPAALLLVLAAILFARLTTGFAIPALRCSFREITGWPCPYCGGTRSLRSLADGQLLDAFNWNPLVFAGAIGAAIWCALSVLNRTTVAERLWQRVQPRLLWLLMGLTLANWIFLLAKAAATGAG